MAYMNFQGPTFTMESPTDWVVSASPQFQAIFLGPTDQTIRPNLVVSLRPIEAGVTYQQVAEGAKESQQQQYPQYEVLEELDYGQAGGFGLLRQYRWFSADNGISVIQKQVFFVVGQMLFSLTATRGDDLAPAIATEYDATFDHMIQSFRITE